MNCKYVLDNHTPVAEPDLMKWATWFEKANRIVRQDKATVKMDGQPVGEVRVSTVFLGLDNSFGGGSPMLFETMVFGGALDQKQECCATWEDAEKMHELMCERVKRATSAVGAV